MSHHHLLPHIAGRIFNRPLLIEPGKLQVILGVLGDRIHASAELYSTAVPGDLDVEEPMEWVADDRQADDGPDIAIISVHGSLVHRSMGLNAFSGLCSYEDLREDIQGAMDDGFDGILLDFATAGGEVDGCFDLVDDIFETREQGYPIWAIANEMAFSAGYALSSAAERLFVTRTGGVGSIGVIAVHVDQSEFDKKIGVKYTPIFAGAKKNWFSPHFPLPEAAQQSAQSEINQVYDLFVQTVARNRGISPDAVKATEAGTFMGKDAVTAGLADGVASYSSVLAQFQQHLAKGGI